MPCARLLGTVAVVEAMLLTAADPLPSARGDPDARAGRGHVLADGQARARGGLAMEVLCAPQLSCAGAVPIGCGETVSGNTQTQGQPRASTYSCAPGGLYTGPEVVLTFANPLDQTVSLLLDAADERLDLMLLEEGTCDEGFCLAQASRVLTRRALPPGSYPVVVDGLEGAGGPFSVTVFCGRTLAPALLEVTLGPGMPAAEHKIASLVGDLPSADVMFSIDTTLSMSEELANLKAAAKEIVAGVSLLVEDLRFGLIHHEDYPLLVPGTPENCGWGYSYGSNRDEPYSLHLPLTNDTQAFDLACDALSLGNGGDGPESYARVMFESMADLAIGWRPGARNLLVMLGDNIPHDCDVRGCLGIHTDATGRDLGRDEIAGTPDDIPILEALDGLTARSTTLIYLDSSGKPESVALWDCYAARTGGSAEAVNPDGTIPGGLDLAGLIHQAIAAQANRCQVLTLRPSPGYEDWLVGLTPAEFRDVELPLREEFDIEIAPPAGTPPGDYSFTMDLLCDGAVMARQQVTVHVTSCAASASVPADAEACEGDTVPLTGSASVVAGCSGQVLYQWSRDGVVIRPWDIDPDSSDTAGAAPVVYRLEAGCFGDPDCPANDSASFVVSPLPDAVPPAIGPSLRVRRSGGDAALSWQDLSPAVSAGSYQAVVLDGTLSYPPTPGAMDAAPQIGEVAPGGGTTLHSGAAFSPCAIAGSPSPCALLYYKVRATSPCSGTPGPTCDDFPQQVPCP